MAIKPTELARRFSNAKVSAYVCGCQVPLVSPATSGTPARELRMMTSQDAFAIEKALEHYAKLVEALGIRPAWEPESVEVKQL